MDDYIHTHSERLCFRIKEGPSTDIQFPELDEKDDVAEAGQLLHLKGKHYTKRMKFVLYFGCFEVI